MFRPVCFLLKNYKNHGSFLIKLLDQMLQMTQLIRSNKS